MENYGKGDAVQIMVSTNGRLLNGRNQGLGWRTRQLGGYISDSSLQHLSQNLFRCEEQCGRSKAAHEDVIVSDQKRNSMDQCRWTDFTPASSPSATAANQHEPQT